jgi:DNA-binding CsgD family transcriptional regulator
MIVHNTQNINVNYIKEQDMLITTWKDAPLKIDDFIRELQHCRDYCINLNVKRTVLNQEDFKFVIPPKLYPWIEEEINLPGYKSGVEDFVFVVAGSAMAQFAVMDSFDEAESVYTPHFFLHQNEALEYLEAPKKEKIQLIDPTVFLKDDILLEVTKDEVGNKAIIQMEVPLDALPYNLNMLKKHMDGMRFMRDNWQKFASLTKREKLVLKHLVKGRMTKEIATKLFISETTVKTHRQNIIRKLNAKHLIDLYKYATVFGIV